ncbi:hypothetical protein JOD54_003523 [Actinokineospora baliensis]|uniref:CPCC family cysteine-rich protein n=1 Tax=Actinokineospora baliensis TaxID=547056 RepID=UPI0027DB9A1A|nr:CPCC family cysteine-rich protein [Actinokineospora baliensis]MBM7773319.1 hypothetical protein [Actinokineospora baliensis]
MTEFRFEDGSLSSVRLAIAGGSAVVLMVWTDWVLVVDLQEDGELPSYLQPVEEFRTRDLPGLPATGAVVESIEDHYSEYDDLVRLVLVLNGRRLVAGMWAGDLTWASQPFPIGAPEERTHPCPCCGYRTFDQPPGSHLICEVCSWEDDAVQLRKPCSTAGANRVSLVEGQVNYQAVGVCDVGLAAQVRSGLPEESRDPGWRSIDLAVDSFEGQDQWGEWPTDLTTLYWWRDTFWRAGRR